MLIRVKEFPKLRPQDYNKVRPKIHSGDLLLCSGSAFLSRLIQKATKSIWSHVAFVVRLDAIDRIMVMESVESSGVRTVPLSHYIRNYAGNDKGYPGKLLLARHRDFEAVKPRQLNRMSQFAVDLFGYPYDSQEILRIAGRIGKSLLGISDSHPKRNREYICSEYAWECYNRLGIRIDYDSRGFVAPKDFAKSRKVIPVAALKVK